MGHELDIYRLSLISVNDELISHYKKRSIIVKKTQALKSREQLELWSVEQELKVFTALLSKHELNIKQCLMFSLMLEDQSMENYPKWSERIHLDQVNNNIEEMINPILLFVKNKTKYHNLKIKDSYRLRIEEIVSDV